MKNNILYIGNNLISKKNNKTNISFLSELLEKEGFSIKISSSKNNKIFRLLDMIFTTFRNRNKIDFILIDTYSTSNFYYALIIARISKFLRIKYIPILHGGNLPNRLNKNPNLSKLIFKNAYKIVSPSLYLKEEFKNRGYKTLFIPNPLHIEMYPYKERNILSPKILWVRAFKNIYNPLLAVETFILLNKDYQNAKLCMIGPFSDSSINKVKEHILKNELKDKVQIPGLLSKIEWHNKSKEYDIFINTSNIDNIPVTIIEAMALGLPIVSTNIGGMPYLINNNVDGLLVDINNPKKMYLAIKSIIEKNNVNFSKKARAKVEKLDWNYTKTKWLEILN